MVIEHSVYKYYLQGNMPYFQIFLCIIISIYKNCTNHNAVKRCNLCVNLNSNLEEYCQLFGKAEHFWKNVSQLSSYLKLILTYDCF